MQDNFKNGVQPIVRSKDLKSGDVITIKTKVCVIKLLENSVLCRWFVGGTLHRKEIPFEHIIAKIQ